MTLTVHAKIKEEICRGCGSYEYKIKHCDGTTTTILSCSCLPFIEDKICPCSSCFIKPICNNMCEDFHEHYVLSKKNKEGEDNE